MQDKKLKILLYLGAAWGVLFLVTLRVKAPMLEGVEFAVLFAALCWFAYWTVSTMRGIWKPKTPEKEENTTPENIGKE